MEANEDKMEPKATKKPTAYEKMISRFTMHGFHDFYENRHPGLKILWFTILCGVGVLLLVETYFVVVT